MTYLQQRHELDRRAGLPASARALLDLLTIQLAEAKRAGRAYVTPTIARLAELTGFCQRQMTRAKAQLILRGLITAAKRFRFIAGIAIRMSDRLYAGKPAPAYPAEPGGRTYQPRPQTPGYGALRYVIDRTRAMLSAAAMPTQLALPMEDNLVTPSMQDRNKKGPSPLIDRSRAAAALAAFEQRRLDRLARRE